MPVARAVVWLLRRRQGRTLLLGCSPLEDRERDIGPLGLVVSRHREVSITQPRAERPLLSPSRARLRTVRRQRALGYSGLLMRGTVGRIGDVDMEGYLLSAGLSGVTAPDSHC